MIIFNLPWKGYFWIFDNLLINGNVWLPYFWSVAEYSQHPNAQCTMKINLALLNYTKFLTNAYNCGVHGTAGCPKFWNSSESSHLQFWIFFSFELSHSSVCKHAKSFLLYIENSSQYYLKLLAYLCALSFHRHLIEIPLSCGWLGISVHYFTSIFFENSFNQGIPTFLSFFLFIISVGSNDSYASFCYIKPYTLLFINSKQ